MLRQSVKNIIPIGVPTDYFDMAKMGVKKRSEEIKDYADKIGLLGRSTTKSRGDRIVKRSYRWETLNRILRGRSCLQ